MDRSIHQSIDCLINRWIYPRSRQGCEAALKATQMEDFGLQAILEKMNSLITPLISGPFWDISNIFQFFLIFFLKFVETKNSIESDFSSIVACSRTCMLVKALEAQEFLRPPSKSWYTLPTSYCQTLLAKQT